MCVCVYACVYVCPFLLSSGCVLAGEQFLHSHFSACLRIANYHSKVKMKAWDTDRGNTTALTTTYIHTHTPTISFTHPCLASFCSYSVNFGDIGLN